MRAKIVLSYETRDLDYWSLMHFTGVLASDPRLEVIRPESFHGGSFADSLLRKLESADFFMPVIGWDKDSATLAKEELRLVDAFNRSGKQVKILPVLVGRRELPGHLRGLDSLDLTSQYEQATGYRRLRDLLAASVRASGVSVGDVLLPKNEEGIITLCAAVSRQLIEHFERRPSELQAIHPRKFEELVAELWSKFGYEVELTKATRDGGRDVVAISKRLVQVKYLIECKRPAPGKVVGVRAVRELFGVKSDEGATKAILATTAHFSRDALLLFQRHRWELEPRDLEGVLEWIREYLQLRLF